MQKREAKKLFADLLKLYRIRVMSAKRFETGSTGRSRRGNEVIHINWRDLENVGVTMAHEIAHVVLGHTKDQPDTLSETDFLHCECEAWLWAEACCKERSIPFDYQWAEDCYESHVYTSFQRVLWYGKKPFTRPELEHLWIYKEAL